MAQATVAAKVHQTFDVHLCVAAKIAFNGQIGVDVFAHFQDFGVREVVYATRAIDTDSFADFFCFGRADTGDICEGDQNTFPGWDVHASNTCQGGISFSLRFRISGTFFHNGGPNE